MRWQWLVVCLAAAVVLAGCERTTIEPPKPPPPKAFPTAKAALAAVDKSVAALDAALDAGGDAEGMLDAARAAMLDIDALGGFIHAVDEKALAQYQEGQPVPPMLMSKFGGASVRMGEAMDALVPPDTNVAKAKLAVADVKKCVDAVRGSIE